ncbi:chemotaxis protein CheA [Methylophaga sp. OBS3]|uniref:chemotaxis protein CheA n=1 Tax=Methylophaga sp. OBS3 TaxID=2991934 RepID=UPI00225B3806|nr:chemotaxis protein CheA [Methylophaga sp. OBS3]MCX4188858.1 chemotaxis protein CheA [Methylophaga sp. OBS3]
MAIDVGQFHQVFFEESHEGLTQMESILLEANGGEPDPERINALFRVVHSIKGGGGTFGFNDLTTFAHALETLMDAVRHNEIPWTDAIIPLLLESVDVLRHILQALESQSEIDESITSDLTNRLNAVLSEHELVESTATVETTSAAEPESATQRFLIDFKPYRQLFHTGNDPARLFKELAEMGEVSVTANISELPSFTDFDPEDCFLSWQLVITTEQDEAAIREVFDWVELDCDLTVTRQDESEDKTDETAVIKEEKAIVEKVNDTTSNNSDEARETKAAAAAPVSHSIRVETDKIDALINMVGELVITQSMLAQMGKDLSEQTPSMIIDGIEELERNTRHLQEGIMQIRMLPISFAFNRFPRLVHDLSAKMGKKVQLKTSGEQTELDKSVMEKIGDPLVHLVRNSLDHGLEMPDKRVENGKPATGTILLNAYQQGGNIVVEISDDGAGLNTQKIHQKAIEKGLVEAGDHLTDDDIHNLIFLPGFSTADEVSDISGRGVGMDVVRKNITGLGGSVDVKSAAGKGSTFTIRLPLTLAIMDGQSVQVADQKYIIPLLSIVESVEVKTGDIKQVSGRGELYRHRQEYIPVIRLQHIFQLPKVPKISQYPDLLVILEDGRRKLGLLVDDLHGQQQVVIKSLETNFRKVAGISAATILGDGSVALILDITGILQLHKQVSVKEITDKDTSVQEA